MTKNLDRSSSATSIWSIERGNRYKDDEADYSIKTNSIKSSKSEGDGRRRTIIVARKNGSFGFTIQSYGIHYKREKEIEVITYVEKVEPNGSAANAGMREGDVIIAINGVDVQLAEHASIVNTIATCESRMRMVVSFENCVRKVELHLKCISIQRQIEEKINELEKLTLAELQLFDGKWKSRSLPAPKKKNSPSEVSYEDQDSKQDTNALPRPTMSSENMTDKPKAEVSLPIHQYLNPYQYIIRPTLCDVGFIVRMGLPNTPRNTNHIVLKPSKSHKSSTTSTRDQSGKDQKKKQRSADQGHSCSACIPHVHTNADGNSLEAYDLASPCCDPRCIPNARRRSRRQKSESSKERRKEKSASAYEKVKSESCCTKTSKSHKYRLLQASPQNAAHSYSASVYLESNDYKTLLTEDTGLWENNGENGPSDHRTESHHKQKSWDNLTAKSFGGYGFGYGYLDVPKSGRSKSGHKSGGRSCHSNSESQYINSRDQTSHYSYVYHDSPNMQRHQCSAKSTDNLIMVPKQPAENACECSCRRPNTAGGIRRSSDGRSASFYAHHVVYPTYSIIKKKETTNSLITRL